MIWSINSLIKFSIEQLEKLEKLDRDAFRELSSKELAHKVQDILNPLIISLCECSVEQQNIIDCISDTLLEEGFTFDTTT